MKDQHGSAHLPIILALLFGAAVVVTIFGYMLWPKDEEISTDTVIDVNKIATAKSNNENKNTSIASDPTAGWKTYTDSDGRFMFRYPEGMTTELRSARSEIAILLNGSERYSLVVGSKIGPVVSNKSSNPECYRQTETLGTEPVWSVNEFLCGIGSTPNPIVYSTADSSIVYEFSKSEAGNYLELELIIQGFRLSSPTANWKTYTNTALKYTYRYPSDLKSNECTNNNVPEYSFVSEDRVPCGTEWFGNGFGFSKQPNMYNQAATIKLTKDELVSPVTSTVEIDGITATRVRGVTKSGPNVMGGGNRYNDFVFLTRQGVGYIINDLSVTNTAYRQADFERFLDTIDFAD